MTEEEIEKRIYICEDRRRGYQEIGNTKIADKYSNEIYKWEQLLNKLDSKRDEQLRDYKIGYEHLTQAIEKAIEYIKNYKDEWCRNDEVVDDMNTLLKMLSIEEVMSND